MAAARLPSPLRGAIVAMTRDRVIGVDGGLPWHYREDLQRFKRRTMGCAVVMGRVTWDSINRKPLPGRRNIVISRAVVSGVEHYPAIQPALDACGDQDLWVIGGAQIYKAALPHLNLLDITLVPDTVNHPAAVKFPEIDLSRWIIAEEEKLCGDEELTNTVYKLID